MKMSLPIEDDGYDPYKCRNRSNLTSNCETLINLIKAILGIGILAMPEAFRNSGFLIGTVGTLVLTFLETYCLHLLYRGLYQICKSKKIPQINFPEACQEALLVGPECSRKFAPAAPYIVNFFIIVYQIGSCCVYTLFVSANVKDVIDTNTDQQSHMIIEVYIFLLLLPLLLISYVRNMKKFAIVSYIGNIVTAVGLIIIYYYCFRDIGPITDRNIISDFKFYPLFMGTTMVAVLSIGAILSVEYNMKNPYCWGGYFGILNIGMAFVTLLNIFTGFVGYWKYGDACFASITLNLDIREPLAWAVRIAFAIAIFLSFALQMYPPCEIIWEQYAKEYMKTSEYQLFWEYALRTCLVLFVILLSISIPRLGLFIPLFGGFCLFIVGMVIPPLLDLCLHYPDNFGICKYVILRDIVLIIFGLISFVVVTSTSVYKIIESFQ